MKKISYNEKLNAVLAYMFLVGFLPHLKKNKSSFLKRHLKRGKFLNICLIIWLVVSVVSYRVIPLIGFLELKTIKLIETIFLIFNIIICLLVFMYQLYWLVKIIRKKG